MKFKTIFVYLVDSGSYVEDYMGYVSGDYNFNFVNDASALYLTVGRKKYEAINIDENTVWVLSLWKMGVRLYRHLYSRQFGRYGTFCLEY